MPGGKKYSCLLYTSFERVRKDPDGVGILFAAPQQFRSAVRQDDGSGSGVGLGVARHQPPALFPVESSVCLLYTSADAITLS